MNSRASCKRFWWLEDGVPAPVRRAARDEHMSRSMTGPLLADDEAATPADVDALRFWRALSAQAHGGPLATDPGA